MFNVGNEEGAGMISADAIRGYVDLMVLSLLRKGPSYAYQLVQQISTVTGADYTIKQTTLYSAVKRLEASGLVTSFPGTSDSGKPRTYYRITETGLTHLDQKIVEWRDTKVVVDRFVEGIST
ncbi:PadR family transcriptional regulator [Okibacterium endophyticum]